MVKINSKSGCVTCKVRKKKCDELKPRCSHCVRLELPCSYDSGRSTYNQPRSLGHLSLSSPTTESRHLRPVTFSSEVEQNVVQIVPRSVVSFFTPSSKFHPGDLDILWKLMLGDELVRSALVTCFSRALGRMQDYQLLHYNSYGKTLRLLRAQINQQDLEVPEKLKLALSVQFLGLMESTSNEPPHDYSPHWVALANIIADQPRTEMQKSVSQRNLYLIVFEGLAFHILLSFFFKDIYTVHALWRRARVFEVLEYLNPPGSDRIGLSPLSFGQYGVIEMVHELTFLHRLQMKQPIQRETIDQQDEKLKKLQHSYEVDFKPNLAKIDLPEEKREAINVAQQLYFVALSICIKALREPTEQVAHDIECILMSSLGLLSRMAEVNIGNLYCTWPLIILICATKKESDISLLLSVSREMKVVDGGAPGTSSRQRLSVVLEAVRRLHRSPDVAGLLLRDGDRLLPPGLLLFRKQEGIIS